MIDFLHIKGNFIYLGSSMNMIAFLSSNESLPDILPTIFGQINHIICGTKAELINMFNEDLNTIQTVIIVGEEDSNGNQLNASDIKDIIKRLPNDTQLLAIPFSDYARSDYRENGVKTFTTIESVKEAVLSRVAA